MGGEKMGKRIKKKDSPLLKKEFLEPVDPEQFGFAIQIASAAHAFRMPMESPSTQGVNIEMGDGEIKRLVFTDIPINRAFMAMRDHFAPDFDTFQRVGLRFFALHKIWNSKNMEKWTKKDKDDPSVVLINEAVFRAGATCPLNEKGEFEETSFFMAVEKFANEKD
jgi:hypothetical protein